MISDGSVKNKNLSPRPMSLLLDQAQLDYPSLHFKLQFSNIHVVVSTQQGK